MLLQLRMWFVGKTPLHYINNIFRHYFSEILVLVLALTKLVSYKLLSELQITTHLNMISYHHIVMKSCSHLEQINLGAEAKTKGCEECEKIGDTWVHLRLCLSCGHVGCCDSSKNKHGTKHFKATSHPVIKSYEPGENWKWCYVDEIMKE